LQFARIIDLNQKGVLHLIRFEKVVKSSWKKWSDRLKSCIDVKSVKSLWVSIN
jgi:hypothetical protein